MISEKDIKYIASLSRIHIEEEQVKHLTEDLKVILGYIGKLEKLDVSNIDPTNHVLPLVNVFREDKPHQSLSQQEALKFSVEQEKGSFKVPKIIE